MEPANAERFRQYRLHRVRGRARVVVKAGALYHGTQDREGRGRPHLVVIDKSGRDKGRERAPKDDEFGRDEVALDGRPAAAQQARLAHEQVPQRDPKRLVVSVDAPHEVVRERRLWRRHRPLHGQAGDKHAVCVVQRDHERAAYARQVRSKAVEQQTRAVSLDFFGPPVVCPVHLLCLVHDHRRRHLCRR